MAIDRDIIKFENGGLYTKRYDEIFNMLVNNLRAVYGEDIDISPESPQGNELRFMAALLSEFSSTIGMMNSTFDLNAARGQHLDNLVLFSTGLTRQAASFSRVSTISIELPAAASVSLTGQWELTTLEGVKWITPAGTVVVKDPVDPIYTMNLICDVTGPNIINELSVINALYINGTFITDDITIVGVPAMSEVGADEEKDRQFLTRANGALGQGSKTLAESVKQLLLSKLPGVVKDAKVINSNGATDLIVDVLTEDTVTPVKSVTIPVHDIFVVVQPRDGVTIDASVNGLRIAALLQEQITPGIRTLVKTTGGTRPLDPIASYLSFELDAGPNYGTLKETVRFKAATKYDPVINIKLKKVGAGVGTSAEPIVESVIRNKIKALSETYVINQEISITDLRNQIEDGSARKRYVIDDAAGGVTVTGGVEVDYGYWFINTLTTSITFNWS